MILTHLEKCLLADLLMIAVHFLSQSFNTYLTGLVLGFPDLSILAYSFFCLCFICL